MAIRLTNVPNITEPGGLWFIMEPEYQEYVKPWIKSMIMDVTKVTHRRNYRMQLTKAAMSEDFTRSIWARSDSHSGCFCFYASRGTWRVGDRGIALVNLGRIKLEIAQCLEAFIDQNQIQDQKGTQLG